LPRKRRLPDPDEIIETEGGAPKRPPRHTKDQLAHEKLWAGAADEPTMEPPRWFNAMVAKRYSLEEIAETLVDRARKGTTSPTEALAIANEIGRDPEGGALIHKHLTQSLLEDLVRNAREA
jgi:hypothetical protein